MAKRRRGPPKEVFLSHASADRKFVDQLAEVLRNHGIPVWYSTTNILGAQQWHDEIGKALQRCDWFLVVLSPRAVVSKWVKREILFALTDNRFENRIVPVLSKSCHPKKLLWTLESYQMIDFRGRFETGCRELLRIWGLGYRGR
jgi:hypothetical protein